MSTIITRTYHFTDGTTAYGSQVEAEVANIVSVLNSLDSASTTWDNVKVTSLQLAGNANANGNRIASVGTPSTSGDAAQYPITNSQIAANTITNASITSQTIRGSTANSSATAQEISQGTISTPDFRANAVSQQVNSISSGFGRASPTQLTTTTITTIGGYVLVGWSASVSGIADGSGLSQATVVLQQDGANFNGNGGSTVVQGSASGSFSTTLSGTVILTPSAGSHTYKLSYQLDIGSAPSCGSYTLYAIELRA